MGKAAKKLRVSYDRKLQIVPPNDLDEVPCTGRAGEVDFSPFTHGENVSRELARVVRSLGMAAVDNLCSRCPVENHMWCLEQVQPSTTEFSGVAGSRIWLHGRRVA